MNYILLFIMFCYSMYFAEGKVGISAISLQSARGEMNAKNFQHLHGYRLKVSPDKTLEVEKEIKCTASCIRNKECFSFNTKKISSSSFLCELLNTSKYRNLKNLTKDESFIHYYLQDPCLPPCSNNGTCVVDSDGTSTICKCPEMYLGKMCERKMDPDRNYALYKPTTQKTGPGNSGRAVDGNENRYWSGDSCTMTQKPHTPGDFQWWRVDFREEIQVARVKIINRADCCGGRLGDFAIKIGNSLANSGLDNRKCAGDHLGLSLSERKTFMCSPVMKGQYLVIQSYVDDMLTICEVKVYANP